MYKHSTGTLNNTTYDVVAQAFRDTVQVMVYKNNKLGKIFKTQLYPQPGGIISDELVLPTVTPQALLGSSQEDAAGQLYASVIASMVCRQSPDDTRQVILGLGAIGPRDSVSKGDREELLLVTKLVEEARVW